MTAEYDALSEAVTTFAVSSGAIDEGHLVVAWTLVGEMVSASDPDITGLFHLTADPIDPFLQIGLLATRLRDMQRWCDDDGPGSAANGDDT